MATGDPFEHSTALADPSRHVSETVLSDEQRAAVKRNSELTRLGDAVIEAAIAHRAVEREYWAKCEADGLAPSALYEEVRDALFKYQNALDRLVAFRSEDECGE